MRPNVVEGKNFINDLIERNPAVTANRLGFRKELLVDGGVLLAMWLDAGGCRIRVLAPVTKDRNEEKNSARAV
jgi:hypothetical protein